MIDELSKYIAENFPDFYSEIHVRFELGDPFDNGTDERINQVVYRVTTLFEEMFKKNDLIYLYIKDWEEDIDVMFGNTTPNRIYDLINHHELLEAIMYEYDEDIDGEGGYSDAIYFHTENPEHDFPYWLNNIDWNIEIPQILIGLLDLSKFNIGKINERREDGYSYIIQKRGLGLEIHKK